MPTPATRTPVRVARGTYANLNTSIADILDGELVYATDQDKFYVKEAGALVATYLTSADVGVTVQGYDADTAKLDVAQTFTAVQTLTDPAIIGTILEDVFTITDGAAFEVDPGNGSIQLITLGDNRTPKATNFAEGEAVTLMVDDGSAYTLTWTDATWGGSGVEWKTNAGAAPTLNTTGYTVITFWKVGTQIYGARVGDA
jgi:hypothetical protein